MDQHQIYILIGLQFGDEGKGRILDTLVEDRFNTKEPFVVARFNGGANAGHTLKRGDLKLVTNLVPSGIFYPNAELYIGSGCALDPIHLHTEMNKITAAGYPLTDRIKLSCYSSLVQPHHLVLDVLWGELIGTTGNGIGTCYSDQAIRAVEGKLRNIRVADAFEKPDLAAIVRENLHDALALVPSSRRERIFANTDDPRRKRLFSGDSTLLEEEITAFSNAALSLRPFVTDPLYLEERVRSGTRVIYEGAQAPDLDRSKGWGSFTTGSHTLASYAFTGGDIALRPARILGVAKLGMSRVGAGPFISEFGGRKSEEHCMKDNGRFYTEQKEKELYPDPIVLLRSGDPFLTGVGLRRIYGEYGARTRRPRRTGAFDSVQVRHNCILNGVHELYLTALDRMREFSETPTKEVSLVVSYLLDRKPLHHQPATAEAAYRTEPVFTYHPAFCEPISELRTLSQLPPHAQSLLTLVQEGLPEIHGVGVGPEKDQFISLR